MKEAALKEYIDRAGIVTKTDLLQQAGAARQLIAEPLQLLLEKRDVFYCRFVEGQKTLISRHLIFCLRAVLTEPDISQPAQEIYDWVSEHEFAVLDKIRHACALKAAEFESAFKELQQKLYITPGRVGKIVGQEETVTSEAEMESSMTFLWVTDEIWLAGLTRPQRYKDLEYCLSEVSRLLKNYYSTREINKMLYDKQ